MRIFQTLLFSICVFVAINLASCTGPQALEGTSEAELLGGTQEGDFGALLAEADAHWAQRDDLEHLKAAMDALARAADTASPSLSEDERRAQMVAIYERLARAHFMLANAVLPLASPDPTADSVLAAQEAIFDRGREYAERALGLAYPSLVSAVAGGAEFSEALVALDDPKAAGLMFWWIANLGRWLSFQGGLSALPYLDDLERVALRAYDLDPAFFYYGPTAYLGGFFTRLPLPSGDMDKAKTYFKAAIKGAPDMLSHRVAFADLYATKAADRAMFESLLREVIDADLSQYPDAIAPENRTEQQRARWLLNQANDLF